MLIDAGGSSAAHWDDKAREIVAALIIYVTRKYRHRQPELCTLARIRALTSLGHTLLPGAISDGLAFGSVSLTEVISALQGAEGSDEYRSVVSNADKAMKLFSSDRPGGIVTRASDFRFEDFANEVSTCYLMIDENKLPSTSRSCASCLAAPSWPRPATRRSGRRSGPPSLW